MFPTNAPPPSAEDRERLQQIGLGKLASSTLLGSIADELEKIAKALPDDVRERIMGRWCGSPG